MPRTVRQRISTTRVRQAFELLHGAPDVELEAGQAAVTCLVKNGDYYAQAFIEHYLSAGFRHIFLLDNGSDDATVDIARGFEDVSVYRCLLPVGSYQGALKRAIAQRAVHGGWCLDVDIDEFFEYPHSNRLKLDEFLRYLDERDFTAVLTQMVDMFSDERIASLAASSSNDDFQTRYRYYDLSAARSEPYRASTLAERFAARNQLGNPESELFFGGIRGELFGLDCLLTKHSLFRTDRDLELFSQVHFVNRASVADVSAAILHYKLVSNCYETSVLNHEAFPATRQGYEDLMKLIESKPDHRIRTDTAREFDAAEDLLDQGFLFASPDYLQCAGLVD